MNNTEIENIFNQLLGYNAKYDIKLKLFSPSLGSLSDKVLLFLFIVELLAIVFTFIIWYFDISSQYQLIPLSFVAMIYIGLFIYPISVVIEKRQDLAQFAKNMLSKNLSLVERNCIEDIKLIESLLSCNLISVEYVCKQLAAERLAFERRIGVLIGALEKIGVIPGLATLFLALSEINISSNSSFFVVIAIGMPLLYILEVYIHYLFNRLDRYIMLFEHVLTILRGNGSAQAIDSTR